MDGWSLTETRVLKMGGGVGNIEAGTICPNIQNFEAWTICPINSMPYISPFECYSMPQFCHVQYFLGMFLTHLPYQWTLFPRTTSAWLRCPPDPPVLLRNPWCPLWLLRGCPAWLAPGDGPKNTVILIILRHKIKCKIY